MITGEEYLKYMLLQANNDDFQRIGDLVKKEFQAEFTKKFYTGNAARDENILVIPSEEECTVIFKAPKYSFKKYQETGAIVKTYKGSYASEVDIMGSKVILYRVDKKGNITNNYKILRPLNHMGYAQLCVERAIETWLATKQAEAHIYSHNIDDDDNIKDTK